MILKLTPKFIIAFLALTFVMHEAHEIVHTTVGRFICGCWGERDFNVWGLCEGCDANPYSLISTFVGPLFTFIMVWLGANLLSQNNSNSQKSLGFALIFANMPFARLLNPILGGGDEATVLNHFLHNRNQSNLITGILVTLIIAYPLYRAFITIKNKYRIGLFLLFLLAPVIIDLLLVLGVMNTLLEKGVLSQYWILGSPMLVTVWTASVVLIFVIFRKSIYKLAK